MMAEKAENITSILVPVQQSGCPHPQGISGACVGSPDFHADMAVMGHPSLFTGVAPEGAWGRVSELMLLGGDEAPPVPAPVHAAQGGEESRTALHNTCRHVVTLQFQVNSTYNLI